MPAFEYSALDAHGETRKGVVDGDGLRQVRSRLREQGLAPLSVVEVKQRQSVTGGSSPWGGSGVTPVELALATRQLATLLRAGIPLADSLAVVARQTARKRMQGILMAVRARVLEGHPLAVALGGFPQLFPSLYRETVAAGEQTGKLDLILERLATYLESSQQLRQRVVLAMIYPLVVLTFALLISIALLTYVVPQVVQVFADFKQELPWLTRALISVSHFLRQDGIWLLALLVGLVVGTRRLFRQPGPRRWWHALLLRLPLIARLVRGVNTVSFVRTLAILINSGVPVLEGLAIAGRVIHNIPMRQVVEQAAVRVREGKTLYAGLEEGQLFSPLVLHLIAGGETGGDLAGMLEQAALAQEREVESLVALLAGLFEPLLILFMGGIVLTIVVAILLPVFDLNQLVK